MVQQGWQDSLVFLTSGKILLPYKPAIVLLDNYPKELKTYVTDTYGSFIHNFQNL